MSAVIVSVTEMKQFLQITHSKEDAVLAILGASAEDLVAGFLNTKFKAATTDSVVEYLDGSYLQYLWPKVLPILGVTKIEDRESDWDEVDADLYTFDESKIIRLWSDSWGEGDKRWKVTYTGGYSPGTCPAYVKHAILQVVYRAYQSRGAQTVTSGSGFTMSLSKFRDSDIADGLRGSVLGRTIL